MKNLKSITAILLVTFLAFTSCQDELDSENGQNPNTNAANSQTASNLKRSSMYDGSFDDFLDGTSCSSILLPVVANVNGIEVTLLTQSDYQLVLNILGQITNDNDIITLQFPLTVKTSNYTEVVVTNQAEYDALIDACETLENEGKNAISCIDIDFPITILTYSLTLEQTGSVVIESEQELYTYMNNFGNNELFAIKYPIAATLNNDTVISITSDLDLQASISDCLDIEDAEDTAEAEAKNLETIIVDGSFKVQSFITAGVNKTTDYANYTIDFANDLTCKAVNATISTVEGTYEVTSETDVFLDVTFSGNAAFSLLNHTWEVTSFNNTSISLKSTTNAAITLVLTQI
ncbi:hypothetical protein [Confluentibacter citreus]|uniref:hypothetical protein n=1 Tax=Confluentibacter citreus TaxID=2007307 RepID=UPI000C290A97|nr:hypothetical protein [Confluentibacter citreus]